MTLIKELHDNQGAIIGYQSLDLGEKDILDVDLISLFSWFKDAGAVDIYMDYHDDLALLKVIKSYLRYKVVQTSTTIGKKAPDFIGGKQCSTSTLISRKQ